MGTYVHSTKHDHDIKLKRSLSSIPYGDNVSESLEVLQNVLPRHLHVYLLRNVATHTNERNSQIAVSWKTMMKNPHRHTQPCGNTATIILPCCLTSTTYRRHDQNKTGIGRKSSPGDRHAQRKTITVLTTRSLSRNMRFCTTHHILRTKTPEDRGSHRQLLTRYKVGPVHISPTVEVHWTIAGYIIGAE